MRRSISSTGTGSEALSYSLQYAQERLQKRIGTICAITTCRVEASARPTMPSSRSLRVADLMRLLRRVGMEAVAADISGSVDYNGQHDPTSFVPLTKRTGPAIGAASVTARGSQAPIA